MSFWSQIYKERISFFKGIPRKGHQVIGDINQNKKSDSGFYVDLLEYNNLEGFISYKNVSRSKWLKQMNRFFDVKKIHCYNVIESTRGRQGEKPIINLSYKEISEDEFQAKAINDYHYRERLSNLFHNFASELFKNGKKQQYIGKKEYKQWEQQVNDISSEKDKLISEYRRFLVDLFDRTLWKISYLDLNDLITKIKSGEINFLSDETEKSIFKERLKHYFPDPKYELIYKFNMITRSIDGYHKVVDIIDYARKGIIPKKGKIELDVFLRKTPEYVIMMTSKEVQLMTSLILEMIASIKSELTQTEKYAFVEFTRKNLLNGEIEKLNQDGQLIVEEGEEDEDSEDDDETSEEEDEDSEADEDENN